MNEWNNINKENPITDINSWIVKKSNLIQNYKQSVSSEIITFLYC